MISSRPVISLAGSVISPPMSITNVTTSTPPGRRRPPKYGTSEAADAHHLNIFQRNKDSPMRQDQCNNILQSHQQRLSTSGSGPFALGNVQIAVFAPVDPWHCRRSHRNQGESVGAHTASDAVCARAIRPLVGLVGRKCQGLFVAAEDQRRRAADNSPSEHPLPGARRT